MQYWLLRYNKKCPGGWSEFKFPMSSDIYCYTNSEREPALGRQVDGLRTERHDL